MDAAFRSAQAAWDNMAPPEHDDDDDPSAEELDDARDEFLADTFATSLWLNDHLRAAEGTVTATGNLWHGDMTTATIDQLWVLVLTGIDRQALRARNELVERMCKSSKANILARVPAIRASNLADAAEYRAEARRDAALGL
jgi:hypothetical protein